MLTQSSDNAFEMTVRWKHFSVLDSRITETSKAWIYTSIFISMENFWRLSMKKEDAFLNTFFLPLFHILVKIKFSPFLSIFSLGLELYNWFKTFFGHVKINLHVTSKIKRTPLKRLQDNEHHFPLPWHILVPLHFPTCYFFLLPCKVQRLTTKKKRATVKRIKAGWFVYA